MIVVLCLISLLVGLVIGGLWVAVLAEKAWKGIQTNEPIR